MYHDYPFDRNVLEFIIDRTVVRNNDEFTSALNAAGINRSARIKAIWTSDSEPTYGGAGSTMAENERNIILSTQTRKFPYIRQYSNKHLCSVTAIMAV